jgi:ketosteroid isomerase-like protein
MWKMSMAFLPFLICTFPALSEELTKDEQAVWDLEVAYWEYVKSNDIPGYQSLWDESVVAWPGFSRTPIMGKENVHEWFQPYHEDLSKSFDCELTLGAVRSFGNVVAAHYLVRIFLRSAETGEVLGDDQAARVTHTWQRRGDTWKIVTGMSGSLISEGEGQ